MVRSPERLLVIVGPSGAGRSEAVRRLVADGLIELTPTWTTRPPRREELASCVEHRFVSELEFERLERCGAFLATARLPGAPFRYALPPVRWPQDGRVAAVTLGAALVPRLRRLVADLTVYQVEDEHDRAVERLRELSGGGAGPGSPLTDQEAEVALGRVVAQRIFVNCAGPAVLADVLGRAIRLDFAAAPLPELRVLPV
jgi:ribose 1,5-bisphosphokinase PhnN